METVDFEEKCRLFHLGENLRCYQFLGAFKEDSAFVFRAYDPSADSAFVVGSFNDWQESLKMERVTSEGIFEARIGSEKVKKGDTYKYKFYRGKEAVYVADAFAIEIDDTPYSNSVVSDIPVFSWRDDGWMEQRSETRVSGFYSQPINIYELDLASWKLPEDGGCCNYRDVARELAPYVKQMGYTHVQLLPLTKRETSVGSFAPVSSFGKPWELMDFVDTMHRAGVGVIFEWEIGDVSESLCDYSRAEMRSFLVSNAVYWVENYHADGLCIYASSDDLTAEFLQEIVGTVKAHFADVLMIAENGDLGCDLSWNHFWMRNMLEYAATDFKERAEAHGKLTFSMNRAFDEKYILPVSYSDVTGGKKSFLDKMPGDYWKKFAGARAFEVLKLTTPGKNLTFMGTEIGQFSEWTRERGVEWFLLDFEAHARHQLFCSALNNFYLAHTELWQGDENRGSFNWIDADDGEKNIISFRRIADGGGELIVVINFAPHTKADYFLPVPDEGVYEEIFNSDDMRYGGSGVTNKGVRFKSLPNPFLTPGVAAENLVSKCIRLRLPPLGATVLKLTKKRFEDLE